MERAEDQVKDVAGSGCEWSDRQVHLELVSVPTVWPAWVTTPLSTPLARTWPSLSANFVIVSVPSKAPATPAFVPGN